VRLLDQLEVHCRRVVLFRRLEKQGGEVGSSESHHLGQLAGYDDPLSERQRNGVAANTVDGDAAALALALIFLASSAGCATVMRTSDVFSLASTFAWSSAMRAISTSLESLTDTTGAVAVDIFDSLTLFVGIPLLRRTRPHAIASVSWR
jgi:hypothetical protein